MAKWRALLLASALLVTASLLAAPAAAADDQPYTTCSLEIVGYGNEAGGIARASLSCEGDTISAVADPTLLPFVSAAPGVEWRADNCSLLTGVCMLRICGDSRVHFQDATIIRLAALGWNAVLCFSQNTNARVTNATFSGNAASLIGVSRSADLQLSNSTVSNNYGVSNFHIAGVGAINNASVSISGCAFTNNTQYNGNGAVLRLTDNATAAVTATLFQDNRVKCDACRGGAAAFGDNATVTFTDCRFSYNNAQYAGGAIFTTQRAAVAITDSLFNNNSAMAQGGALCVRGDSRVELRDLVLTGNQAEGQGGAIAAAENVTLLIRNCLLDGNAATSRNELAWALVNIGIGGGAVSAAGSGITLLLQDTNITHNTAHLGGGVLLISNATLRLSGRVSISGNEASRSGGGFAADSPNFDPAALVRAAVNNTSPYDPNIGLATEQIKLLEPRQQANIISRLGAYEGLLLVKARATALHQLPSVTDVHAVFDGSLQDKARSGLDGVVSFSLKVRRPPGQYNLLLTPADNMAVQASLLVKVLECPIGDVSASSDPGLRSDACITCVAGSFSLNPANTTCDACPAQAECPGAWRVLPMPGHWSSHQRSPQIHRCNNAAACPGGNSSTCAHGYTSNLCGSCAPGWGTSKPFTCRKCWSKAATITLYVLAGLAMLGLAKLLCHVTMSRPIGQALGQQQQQQQQQPAGASGSNLSGQLPVAPTPTDLIKPFVVYLQFLWVVAALQGIDEPDTLAVPLQAVMWLFSSSTPQSMSLECVLRSGGAVLLPVQVFALSISMPLLLMGVLLVLETVRACWAGRRSAWGRAAAFRAEKHRLVAQAIVLMFLFYPMLMRSVLSLFACIPLDAPVQAPYHAAAVGSFWVGHMSQLCWQGYHRVLVLACGVPLLILLGVLLPATKLTVLIINRKSLYTHAGFLQFSFLYSMYRPRMFFWEVVVLYQATLLVAISVFSFSMGAYYACLALTAALAFSMALHAWLHPYASSVAGNTAMRGIACVCFTSFAALSFLPPAGSPGQASGVNQRYAMVAGAVVLAVNVAYIVSVAVQLARTVNWRALRSIAARWGHKLCGCGKPTPAVGGQAAADKSPQQESVC